MDIVVLVKQVPSTDSVIQIAEDNVSIITDGLEWVMNPYDEMAVEEALRIKEAHGGKVIILSIGTSKRVEETVRTAIAMGADHGVLVKDPLVEGSDADGTARILTAALKNIEYDLIIAGHRAVDHDNYQVGSTVAGFLGIPQISQVIKEEIKDNKIICNQSIEGGMMIIEASLPALFTTQRGLNEPRHITMQRILKAGKQPLEIKTLADLGVDSGTVGAANAKVKITTLKFPPEREEVVMFEEETVQERAAALVKALNL